MKLPGPAPAEFWRDRPDWSSLLRFLLIAANLLTAVCLLWYAGGNDFRTAWNLPAARFDRGGDTSPRVRSDTAFVPRKDASPSTPARLPARLARLGTSEVFRPRARRLAAASHAPSDTASARRDRADFRMVGRVTSDRGADVVLLRRRSDRRSLVVREGDTVGQGPFRLRRVGDTTATLLTPDGRRVVLTLPVQRPAPAGTLRLFSP